MKKIVLFVISAVTLVSCSNNPKEESSNQQTAEQEEHQTSSENAEAIQLNDGEKWLVNIEMKPFVSEGENLVDSYLKNKQTDYNALAIKLKAQNSQLVKSCTMNGKSHEELHKWLKPHSELVKNLQSETNATTAMEIVGQLQGSYQLYHQYFN